MNEKQEYILKLLLEIDEVCKNEKIEYGLAGGTMLGAVRHGGFIPWDDDVDIFMTKRNFDKLRDYFTHHQLENRVLVHKWNNEKYPMIIARYYATDNTCLQRATAWDFMPAGQYIDIMILFPMPIDESLHERFLEDMALYIELTNEFYSDDIYRSSSFLRRYDFWNRLKRVFGRDFVLRHFEKKLFKYSDDECEYYVISHCAGHPLMYPRSVVRDVMYVDFEKTRLPIVKNIMDSFWYGYGSSWRMMPPKSGQATHKLFDDFNLPYRCYMDDFMRFVKQDDAFRSMKNYKDRIIHDGDARMHIYKTLQEYRSDSNALLFERSVIEDEIDLDEEFRNRNYQVLSNYFRQYFNLQLSFAYRQWDSFIDIGDHNLYIACWTLIYYGGQYFDAAKVLRMRQSREQAMTPELLELLDLIEQIEGLYHAMDFEGIEEVRKQVEAFDNKEHLLDYCLAEVMLLEHDAKDEESIDRLISKSKEYILMFPYCWDFVYYLASGFRKKGMDQEAEIAEDMVVRSSRNGLLIRNIEQAKGA